MAAFRQCPFSDVAKVLTLLFLLVINGTNKYVNCPSPEVPYSSVLFGHFLLYVLGFSWRGNLGWGEGTLPGTENLGQEPRNLGDQKRKIIRHRAFSSLAENLPEAEESLPGGLISIFLLVEHLRTNKKL